MTYGLLAAGARVAAVGTAPSRWAKETEQRAHQIAAASNFHLTFGDLGIAADCERITQEILAAFGRIDVLVNNAGARIEYPGAPFWRVPTDEWNRIVRTNCDSVFFMSRCVAPGMIEKRFGKIINISTSARTMVRHSFTPYGPSKAFVEACTRSWAEELQGTGVTINALLPGGAIDTSADVGEGRPAKASARRASVMVEPLLWLTADESNGFSGLRLVADRWDAKLLLQDRVEAAREDGAAVPGIM
jgi:NAD(P)-dependent dehydrogenase (short-subunit alcohol dehydrogenase family)